MDPSIDQAKQRHTEAAEDRALMARVQNGDETAFAALMERWERPTKAVVARIVLNSSEAEELAQEAFVHVWQKRSQFRPDAEFRPWLFAIAVNLARNRLRWWRRRPNVSLDEWRDSDDRGGTRHDQLAADGQPAGAPAIERAETASAVQAAVAALPPDLREALVLFEFEQLSQAEIATIVGATPKAVETRIYRARERLRTALRALHGPSA
jgi:RNA polymerase sigma-70 factor (ECF subfamily)